MPTRILQTGTYSSWNKGDAAMQLSMALAVQRKWTDAKVVVSAPFPKHDRALYEKSASVVPCHRRHLLYASLQLARSALWFLIRRLSGRSADWLVPDSELRATRDADIVIDLSGDMLTDDYGPHVAYSHYIPIINALLLGRPVFICAQSIGPFRWTGWLAKWIFSRAAAITVRDEISLRHLEAIGLDTAQIELTADMAFLLDPAPGSRVDEILRAEHIDLSGRPVLGVSLSRILDKRYAGANPSAEKTFVHIIAATLDRFASVHGADILFVPHVTGPTPAKDDRLIHAEVAAAMRAPSRAISGDYRPDELKGIIGRCALFLGARMHANIAALSSGVPVVALSYSHKTPGIMAMFGLHDRIIDGGDVREAALCAKLDAAWNDRPDTAARIGQACIGLRGQALRNLDIAAAVSETEPRPAA